MRKIDWSAIPVPHESEYDRYLKFDEGWKKRKNERKALDGFKCAFCKSDENLDVHHLTYDRKGHEDVLHDLVTLCHDCHMKLHEKIKYAEEINKKIRETDKENREIKHEQYLLHLKDFYKLHKHLDYAMGGSVDFQKNDVLEKYVPKWLEERGIEPQGGYIERVKAYFIKLRHTKIDELLEEEPGLTIYEIHVITNFNYNFIAKYLKKKGEN